MENKKIKIVWICHFSNAEVRNELRFKSYARKRATKDYSQWNTNAINEFKKFDDVELHVISPHIGINTNVQEFSKDEIYYHFFRSEDDRFIFRLKRKIIKGKYLTPKYEGNTRTIVSIINDINPDLIHVIGAENPYYSISALSMPKDIPLIVTLQTLMIDPDFYKNYPITKQMYDYRSGIEREVLLRADYVTCQAQRFKEVLKEQFNPALRILNMALIVGERINTTKCKKEYDFVYFSKEIEKAADWVIEAFALVHKKHPGITLNIVGGYAAQTKQVLDRRLEELGILGNVSFTGSLPSHGDVINQVRKARVALLPLKIDLISGTIREAMANGLPVVTTITPATPKLNENRKSVLLSEKGDFDNMASNMLDLIENENLYNTLQANGYATVRERYDNELEANLWREAYYAVLEEKRNGTPIPTQLLHKN